MTAGQAARVAKACKAEGYMGVQVARDRKSVGGYCVCMETIARGPRVLAWFDNPYVARIIAKHNS